MDIVTVTVASPAERPVITNLMQFYVHDFSEILVGPGRDPRANLGADGRFPEFPIDAWWREDGHIPMLIHTGEQLAGFALLDAHAHSGEPVDYNMAEFFIARTYRRTGVGLAAACAIFVGWPGQWEIAVVRPNHGALRFWRHAVAAAADAGGVDEVDVTANHWNGAVLRFRSAAP